MICHVLLQDTSEPVCAMRSQGRRRCLEGEARSDGAPSELQSISRERSSLFWGVFFANRFAFWRSVVCCTKTDLSKYNKTFFVSFFCSPRRLSLLHLRLFRGNIELCAIFEKLLTSAQFRQPWSFGLGVIFCNTPLVFLVFKEILR